MLEDNNDYLKQKRSEIDSFDHIIQSAVQKRLALSEKIAVYKFFNGIPIENSKREEEILSGIDSEEIKTVYCTLFAQSKKVQECIFSFPVVIRAESDEEKKVVQLLGKVLSLPVLSAENSSACSKTIRVVDKNYLPSSEEKVLDIVPSCKTTEQCVDLLIEKIYERYRQ